MSACSVIESEISPCLEKLCKDDDADVRYFSEEAISTLKDGK